MKYIWVLAIFSGLIILGCNKIIDNKNPETNNNSPETEVDSSHIIKNTEVNGYLNPDDSLKQQITPVIKSIDSSLLGEAAQIEALVRKLHEWQQNEYPLDGFYPITDEKDSIVTGLDFDTTALYETNLFAKEFLDNYEKIGSTLNQKFKNGEIEWLMGYLPPYGNGANPWCDCQDIPHDNYWEKIDISFIHIDSVKASLSWTWSESEWIRDFNYKVRVIKENGNWRIAYLQGFDFDDFTSSD